jgi:hypothetical protein
MKTIAVWFSCGAASAVAAKKTIEKYSNTHLIRVINNPVTEEHKDNQRFLKDVESWIGIKIEYATNPKYPNNSAYDVWERKKYMSGVSGAPCTFELKKKARQLWESQNKVDYHVLGFTLDEQNRHNRFVERERENVLPILIEEKITKADCFNIIKKAGIKLPEIYSMGYPNANCIGCVKATSATYWNLVREKHPEIFNLRSDQSRRLGVKLCTYKGKRLFLDELLPDAKGRSLKNMDFECGIFCEER